MRRSEHRRRTMSPTSTTLSVSRCQIDHRSSHPPTQAPDVFFELTALDPQSLGGPGLASWRLFSTARLRRRLLRHRRSPFAIWQDLFCHLARRAPLQRDVTNDERRQGARIFCRDSMHSIPNLLAALARPWRLGGFLLIVPTSCDGGRVRRDVPLPLRIFRRAAHAAGGVGGARAAFGGIGVFG
jgi:hypothetical protein